MGRATLRRLVVLERYPTLLALDGLDEVADVALRHKVSRYWSPGYR